LPDYRLFFAYRIPPDYAAIYVGTYAGNHTDMFHLEPPFVSQPSGPPPSADEEGNAYVATLGIGHLVGHTWVTPTLAAPISITGLADRLRRIWPVDEPFIWPVGPYIDDTIAGILNMPPLGTLR
jgi:hypothetical protein